MTSLASSQAATVTMADAPQGPFSQQGGGGVHMLPCPPPPQPSAIAPPTGAGGGRCRDGAARSEVNFRDEEESQWRVGDERTMRPLRWPPPRAPLGGRRGCPPRARLPPRCWAWRGAGRGVRVCARSPLPGPSGAWRGHGAGAGGGRGAVRRRLRGAAAEGSAGPRRRLGQGARRRWAPARGVEGREARRGAEWRSLTG